MIRKFFELNSVMRFIKAHTKRLYCRIYGHIYMITYNKPQNETAIYHKCYCYQCGEVYGDLKFPLYLFLTKVNPQYRTAVEKWLTDIGISTLNIEKLIVNLQRDRIAKIKAVNVNKHKKIVK